MQREELPLAHRTILYHNPKTFSTYGNEDIKIFFVSELFAMSPQQILVFLINNIEY